MNNESIVLYLEDEAEFISEETGIDYDIVMEYLEAEDDYCDELGLNCYGNEPESEEEIVMDEEELNRYVVENTDITLEQAEEIARAEIMYFDKIGITYFC